MMRIAVELSADLATPGEFLADVQAYEAAGADQVWLAPASLEPLTLLAAAAAVTSRVGLTAWLPAPNPWPADLLAAVAATLGRLSRDRTTFGVSGADAVAEAVIGLRAGAAGRPVLMAGEVEHAAALADGLVCELEAASAAFAHVRTLGPPPDFQLWARLPVVAGRSAWREALAAAEEVAATGVVVPHAPNLLDILRNPEEDDRRDLAIAVG